MKKAKKALHEKNGGNFVDFLHEKILPELDYGELFGDLKPEDKGKYYSLTCPACARADAYI